MKQKLILLTFLLTAFSAFSVEYYVDASRPDDSGDGLSWESAKQTIQAAVDVATDGDTVLVTNGVYSTGGAVAPVYQDVYFLGLEWVNSLTNRVCITANVTVRSVNGPAVTIIEGASDNGTPGPAAVRCAYLLSGAVMEGFTLTSGYTSGAGGTGEKLDQVGGGVLLFTNSLLSNCILFGNSAISSGGGAACYEGGILDNCVISRNIAYSGGGVFCELGGVLNNCTVSQNTANDGGGMVMFNNSSVNNCIVWGNTAVNEINIWGSGSTIRNTCSDPVQPGDGNICADPMFKNPNGNYRLRTGSPCVDAGSNDYTPATDLDGIARPVDGDNNGSAIADMGCYELNAASLPKTYYVDASRPDDSGAATNWATAKQTIQAAVDLAADEDTVLVTNGVYATGGAVAPDYQEFWGPVVVNTRSSRVCITKAITVRSVNGAEVTVIQGDELTRCAYLLPGAVMEGFTLTGGRAVSSGGWSDEYRWFDSWGGGAFLLTNSVLNNCILRGNSADAGGGVYLREGGTLNNCLLTGNFAGGGGGASMEFGTLNNCTLTGNSTADWCGGAGGYESTLNNCIVWGNTAANEPNVGTYGLTIRNTCSDPLPEGEGNICADPLFVDATNGNFHLQAGSPCINAGNNSYVSTATDLNGNPRIINDTVDMGAYETFAGYDSYVLTVENGSGDGSYTYGTVVSVTADAPAAGKTFDQWTGDIQYVANVSSASITVTMPPTNVTLTANYKDAMAPAPFVTIGHPGNAADTTGYGAVGYTYQISATEVTIAEFAASGAGNGNENWWNDAAGQGTSAGPNAPAGAVSLYEAMKYCNWLTSGNINTGLYEDKGGGVWGAKIDRATVAAGSVNYFAVPTEDEWYKAAYFKPDASGYSLYANGTDITPTRGTTDGWNYDNAVGQPNYVWAAGCGGVEQNGTYDMMGNVWEWMENSGGLFRGGYYEHIAYTLSSAYRGPYDPAAEHYAIGFRVVVIGGALSSNTVYTLTVNSGSGGGSYSNGAQVSISANAPASGKIFDQWTGDTQVVANVSSASTTVTMPSGDVTLTANYKDAMAQAPFVTIGHPGNAADPTTGYGAVGYTYQISATEVTIAEFAASGAGNGNENFWNDAGQGNSVGPNAPASRVSLYEAMQYCNWLTSGNINSGLYTNNGSGVWSPKLSRAQIIAGSVSYFAVPTEDEWYKAAYFKTDSSGYSLYANGTANVPTHGTTDGWNYYNGGYVNGAPNYIWTAGYGGVEQNGTYDMMGNVYEWMEDSSGVFRGGSCADYESGLRSSSRYYGYNSALENNSIGFRVVAIGALSSNTVYTLTVNSGSGGGSYTNGQQVVISADAAAEGSVFSGWTTSPEIYTNRLANVSALSTTFTMPATNVTLTANYRTAYTITTVAGTNGTITPTNPVVFQGQNQTFSIQPASGYRINTLAIDGIPVSVTSSYTFTNVQSVHTIEATFSAYMLTVENGSGDGLYTNGAVVSVTADAVAEGYTFTGWTVAPAVYTNRLANVSALSTTFTMPATNVTLTANYRMVYTITTTAGANGSISPTNPVVVQGSDQTLLVQPATGYYIASLMVDGAPVSLASSYTFTNLQSAHTIAATFAATSYTLTVENGSGDGLYTNGTVVPITADAAAEGSVFSGWTVNPAVYTNRLANISAASTTFTMPATNVILTASYRTTVFYVDASRPDDSGVATNWATAKKTIQAAVNLTVNGDTVWVTNGVYNTGGKVTPGYSLTNRVCITNAITVRSVNGPEYTLIVGNGPNGSSAVRGVYMSSGTLCGFNVRNGCTMNSGVYAYDCSGGGINLYGGNGIVSNCVLAGNVAFGSGGGSYFGTLNNCVLADNVAFGTGGGSCGGTLNNCTLIGNSANVGGGNINGMLNNCTLSGNSASDAGGGSYDGTLNNCVLTSNSVNSASGTGGGSCYATLNNCTLIGNSGYNGGGSYGGTLDNCVLTNNSASNAGGGSAFDVLASCVLANNLAKWGGGSYYGTLNNCTLIGNSASASGGGSYDGTLDNCMLTNNSASNGGGSSFGTLNNCVLTGNSVPNYGGGSCLGTLNNCTLTGNSACDGGGSYNGTLNNCIVYFNTASRSGGNWYSSGLSYCSTTPHPGGTGNITNAPLFVDATNNNFQLQAGSPCINAGNNSYVSTATDLDGNSRIINGTVDMGAYEFTGLPGDFDCDGLSDEWETRHFGNINRAVATAICSNGVNTIREAYIAGLDPNDEAAFFEMDGNRTADKSVLRWNATSGRVYSVYFSTNLMSGFQPLATNIPWTAGAFTDSVHNAQRQLFYKVDVQLAP